MIMDINIDINIDINMNILIDIAINININCLIGINTSVKAKSGTHVSGTKRHLCLGSLNHHDELHGRSRLRAFSSGELPRPANRPSAARSP